LDERNSAPATSYLFASLDQAFFWTATDLEKKLGEYQLYCNAHRTHSGRDGGTPIEATGSKVVDINK